MDDLISRRKAIDLFPNDALEWDTKGGYIAPHLARRMIKELPSEQPDIIQCRECKEYYAHDHRCRWWNHGTQEAGWCYIAERKEE